MVSAIQVFKGEIGGHAKWAGLLPRSLSIINATSVSHQALSSREGGFGCNVEQMCVLENLELQ
jgi:hypothetical protein